MRKTLSLRSTLRRSAGFTLVELLISLTIIMLISAVALPSFTRAYRNYQLNSAASQLAGIVKLTRLEAVRRNTLVTCQLQSINSKWTLWDDSNGNGLMEPTEAQYVAGGVADLLPAASVPDPAKFGFASLTVLSGGSGSITFDPRGAVSFGGGPTVYALYVGSASEAGYGYRAVLLLPSGLTQMWAATAQGNWHQIR